MCAKKRRRLSVNEAAQEQAVRTPAFEAGDNRQEAVEARKLQEAANKSPQVKEAEQLQKTADNYTGIRKRPQGERDRDMQEALNRSVYGQARESELAGENAISIGRMDKGWELLRNKLQLGDGEERRPLNTNLLRGRGRVLAEAPLQVLDVPDIKEGEDTIAGWTMDTNDAFIKGGIDNKSVFKIWSHLNEKEMAIIASGKSFKDISTFFHTDPEQKRKDYPTLWSPYEGGSASITVRELVQIRDAGYTMGVVLDEQGSHLEAHKRSAVLKRTQYHARRKLGFPGLVEAARQQHYRQGRMKRKK